MIEYKLKGTLAARKGPELEVVLDDLEEMLDGDDPCVATSERNDAPDLVCVDVDYEGEQSGSGVEHVRGLLMRLSALAVRPTIFREDLDGESVEQYLGGTREEARSALAAEAIASALDDLRPGDLRDVVELVLAKWREVRPGAEYRYSDRG